MELARWKSKFQGKQVKIIPDSCAKAIKVCDKIIYPNISVLLQIACTLPVTSCRCEHSASTMRRLNTCIRASMTEERLSNLALIHIHYESSVDLEDVVQKFAERNSRRLELNDIN